MRPWQEYLLSVCTPNNMRSAPQWARDEKLQPRFLDYEDFRADVLDRCGPIASVCLSMAYKPKVIVEMGVHSGSTTFVLCRVNPDARIHGVDINTCIDRYFDTGAYLPVAYTAMLHGVNNLSLHIGNSWELCMPNQVDMCFIDACHTGEAPYLDSIRAWENRNTKGDWCIAWDDYHPNNTDVVRAVDRFCSEVGMELRKLMSWYYIGTKPHSEVEAFL